jgi:hypothetical protein
MSVTGLVASAGIEAARLSDSAEGEGAETVSEEDRVRGALLAREASELGVEAGVAANSNLSFPPLDIASLIFDAQLEGKM